MGVINAFNQYMTHYESNADLRGDYTFLGPDKSYARYYNPRYFEYAEWAQWWSVRSFDLLANYAVKLNKFADAVREYINPMYFRTKGRFVIIRESGVRVTTMLPTEAVVRKRLLVSAQGPAKPGASAHRPRR
jgi:hypothetical protein